MKQSGFDKLIKSALTRDEIVYAGFSAAAVIAFDSLKGLELTDDPEDVPHGYDADIGWEGLGFSRSHLRLVSSRTIPSPNRLSAKLPFTKRLALRIEHCETAKRSLYPRRYAENRRFSRWPLGSGSALHSCRAAQPLHPQ
jgi:hypothetical protein